jgi:hypothetical protein
VPNPKERKVVRKGKMISEETKNGEKKKNQKTDNRRNSNESANGWCLGEKNRTTWSQAEELTE